MPDDELFRWILIGGFAVGLPIGIYHRLRSNTSERLDRRQEGWCLALRPLGLIGIVGVIAFAIHPPWMAWSAVPLPAWARWIGVGLGTAGTLLMAWTFHNLGRNLTDTVVTREQHSLVVSGPYRWVRHPFYVAFLLAMTAMSLVMANWFVFLAGSLAFVMLALRSHKEEANLELRFGDDYRRYRERTGAFFPRLYK